MESKEGNGTKPWLKFYDEGVPHRMDYPQVPLDRLLAESAAKHPDHRAIIFGAAVGTRIMDQAMSYRQLDDTVNRFAAGMQKLGVKKGDRVAIFMPNCPQLVIAYYGTMRAGGIAVPSNFLYTAEEMEHQLNDAGAEIVITLSSFYKKLDAIRANTRLRHIVVTNIKEYFPPLLRLLFTVAKEKKEGHRVELTSGEDLWFQSLLSQAKPIPEAVEVRPEDTACLIYTGGTTGVPKGAELSHRNVLSNAVAANCWAHSREAGEVSIGALPFFHSYGMTAVMNMTIATAGTMVLIPDPRDVLHVMGSISKHKATLYSAVPTSYVRINTHPQVNEFDLSSVRVCLSGAAPLPLQVQEAFQALTGGTLVEAFGMTESSPATHANPLGRNKIGTIGVPLPDTDARIVDVDTGEEELPQGGIGEMIMQGPQVMKGYWQMPTETANVLREHPSLGPGLWLHSGDIARMDEEGYFQIVDRKKDMIICGGFNVYPRDIEEVLYKHPAVQEAGVIGVPDEYRGETVRAFVVLKEGTTATEQEIIDYCREHLAKYKVPSSVEFRASLPTSALGKVLRRELASQ
ncbi:MAG TPA: long-chain fatty acid--CoA ligase [Anaerolineae bacterium]|nr:long-chain fatty acid--CoA ligase [Anaerolineae bacterium]